MAAAQLGFLHSTITPKNSKGEETPDSKSRLSRYIENGQEPPFADISAGRYLWDAFGKSGMFKQGAMGAVPLEWADILSYSQATKAVTEPWELETIFEMSREYLTELERGKNPFTKQPIDRAQ